MTREEKNKIQLKIKNSKKICRISAIMFLTTLCFLIITISINDNIKTHKIFMSSLALIMIIHFFY